MIENVGLVNLLSFDRFREVYKSAVDLGKTRTRFCPEPTEYLTIGHAQSAILNYYYAKMYKGQMVLRFNDVKPTLSNNWITARILEDLQALTIKYTQLTYMSDYYDNILQCCTKLIKTNLAYVDNTDKETRTYQKIHKIQSACRNNSSYLNLEIFEKMLKGEAKQYCLRAKINMQHYNSTLRDPVICRPDPTPHHRTGKKYKVYPTYDLAAPIIDYLEGITYVFRSSQFFDQTGLYWWVQTSLGFARTSIYEYPKINFMFTTLNNTFLHQLVADKIVDGWDDPRMPTIRGLLRKGVTAEALIIYMLEKSPNKNSCLMSWEKLWSINKSRIDPISPRQSAIKLDKISRLILQNIDDSEVMTVSWNRQNIQLGERPLWIGRNILLNWQDAQSLEIGEKVTLLKWGNIQVRTKFSEQDGSYTLSGQYLAEDRDFKKTRKITWLAEGTNLLIAEVVKYQQLLSTQTVYSQDEFKAAINMHSHTSQKYLVDSCLRIMDAGQYVMLERVGYFKIDSISIHNQDFMYRLTYVPDGRQSPNHMTKNVPTK